MEARYPEQAKRLHILFKELNLTAPGLAKKLNQDYPTSIYNYYKGFTRLPEDIAEKILMLYPEVNRDWLLYGFGSIYEEPDTTQEQIDGLLKDNAELRRIIKEKDATIHNLSVTLSRLSERKSN